MQISHFLVINSVNNHQSDELSSDFFLIFPSRSNFHYFKEIQGTRSYDVELQAYFSKVI